MNTIILLAALALGATMTQAVACDGNKEANKIPFIVACAISDCAIIWDQSAYKTEQTTGKSTTTRPTTQESAQQSQAAEAERQKAVQAEAERRAAAEAERQRAAQAEKERRAKATDQ